MPIYSFAAGDANSRRQSAGLDSFLFSCSCPSPRELKQMIEEAAVAMDQSVSEFTVSTVVRQTRSSPSEVDRSYFRRGHTRRSFFSAMRRTRSVVVMMPANLPWSMTSNR